MINGVIIRRKNFKFFKKSKIFSLSPSTSLLNDKFKNGALTYLIQDYIALLTKRRISSVKIFQAGIEPETYGMVFQATI